MDADNEFGTTGERAGRAIRAAVPGGPGGARGALSRGADGRPGAVRGGPAMGFAAPGVSERGPQDPPAAEAPRAPSDTIKEGPSAAGVEGPAERGSPGAVEALSAQGLADAAGAGTSIRGLLDAAQEETRLARSHQARAARLAAQAARLAEEQRERSGWGVVAQHGLRNAMTSKEAKR
ncbi:MAG: hypothetical protein LBK95_16340, partial [Bifidobacteriaceae bacterium]|nr:hypothetical protein [Bifidobacteriaceae bacterium]